MDHREGRLFVAIEGGRLGADDVYQLAALARRLTGLGAAVGAAAAVVGQPWRPAWLAQSA